MCLLCSNFSGFSSYLDQNKNPCMIWVLIPSTTTLLFTLLVHASLTLPSLLNILGCLTASLFQITSAWTLSINSLFKFSLASSPCSTSFSTLPANSYSSALFFFIIMPIILQYTIVYNLLFFPH